MLLTTQYLEEADQLADRVCVIDAGRVVAEGTPDELKSQFGGGPGRGRRPRRGRRCQPPPGSWRGLRRGAGAPRPGAPGSSARRSRDRVAALGEVCGRCEAAAVAVEDIGLRRPTLDEAFLHLTGRRRGRAVDGERDPTRRCPRSWARPGGGRDPMTRLRWTVADGWVMTGRNMAHVIRSPEELVLYFSLPIMFVLVFGYVFGSGMTVPGGGELPGVPAARRVRDDHAVRPGRHRDRRSPSDAGRGVVDRFRSMPMARSALLAGRSGADLIRALLETGHAGGVRAAGRLAVAQRRARRAPLAVGPAPAAAARADLGRDLSGPAGAEPGHGGRDRLSARLSAHRAVQHLRRPRADARAGSARSRSGTRCRRRWPPPGSCSATRGWAGTPGWRSTPC